MDVYTQIKQLQKLPVGSLRERYQEVFQEPTTSTHKQHMVRRIAWRLQADAQGDLSKRAEKRALSIADDRDLRVNAPQDIVEMARRQPKQRRADKRRPVPGVTLTRMYRDQKISVQVLLDGFEYLGKHFHSLSAVARAATGTNWNGLVFFGLGTNARNPAKAKHAAE